VVINTYLRVNKHKHTLPVGREDWMEAVRKDPKSFCDYSSYDGYRVSRTKIVSQLSCSLVTADKLRMVLTPLVERINQLEAPERKRRYDAEQAAYQLNRETKATLEEVALEAKRKESEEREKKQRLEWIADYRRKYPGVKLPHMLQTWAEEYEVTELPTSSEDPTHVVDVLMSGEDPTT